MAFRRLRRSVLHGDALTSESAMLAPEWKKHEVLEVIHKAFTAVTHKGCRQHASGNGYLHKDRKVCKLVLRRVTTWCDVLI
jgi:hypothetical protein